MRRDEILAILDAHQAELKALGVKSLALFGSTARDEAKPDSDVDLLIEFENGKSPTGLSFFGFYEYLENRLGCSVDLVNPQRLHRRMKQRIFSEAIPIFPYDDNQPRVFPTMPDHQPRKDWRVYIDDMVDASARLQRFTTEINFESFMADEMRMSAVERELITIGEATDKLMKLAPEIPQRYPQIDWHEMKGMRNRLVHRYYEVNWEIIWDTIQNNIPTLILQLSELLATEGDSPI